MIVNPEQYLIKHFNGLALEPALFYIWQNSMRFEISDPQIPFDDPTVMRQTFSRAGALFDAVFRTEDELLLMTDILTKTQNNFLHKKPLNVYRKYVKHRTVLNRLQLQEFDDLEEESKTYRYWLPCQKGDIRYPQLLQAICYEDFGHSSRILKSNPQVGSNVYFINLSRNMIFHLYDDRGCDILAADKEKLRFLHEDFNSWILDYDREEIDLLFK
ncbi:DUF3885 domain-containing protein [Planococcus sp. CPCC 101016]|uniref:DUF3885 domain-containing protein n=1 Tax=Planococcus sp. CPCC 101016 TaxID=2599617 RepID=UPI0011B53552|nr:DUF3885 domain-containing protein [Planococcus sp. CPCC 101016]TWT07975.1 DUF3885 domain-containing protein [Planococcus sp. CPCC 101016]